MLCLHFYQDLSISRSHQIVWNLNGIKSGTSANHRSAKQQKKVGMRYLIQSTHFKVHTTPPDLSSHLVVNNMHVYIYFLYIFMTCMMKTATNSNWLLNKTQVIQNKISTSSLSSFLCSSCIFFLAKSFFMNKISHT